MLLMFTFHAFCLTSQQKRIRAVEKKPTDTSWRTHNGKGGYGHGHPLYRLKAPTILDKLKAILKRKHKN